MILDFVGVAVLFVLHNLNPVVVWVKQKSDVLHASIGQTLLPIDAERLEARASRIQVVYSDT